MDGQYPGAGEHGFRDHGDIKDIVRELVGERCACLLSSIYLTSHVLNYKHFVSLIVSLKPLHTTIHMCGHVAGRCTPA